MLERRPLDLGLEAALLVDGVLDGPEVAVGVDYGVAAVGQVAVAGLLVALDVARFVVVHFVGERVLGVAVVLLLLVVAHVVLDLPVHLVHVMLDLAVVVVALGVRRDGESGQEHGQQDQLK